MGTREPAAPPTILDVAEAAAVSKTTASDALRGSGRVSAGTRDAVLDAAARLNYAPNRSARSLRTSRLQTLGLRIPEFLTRSEYYMSFVFGVVEHAAGAGYNVTLISAAPGTGGPELPQVDGIVLCDPESGDPTVQRLLGTSGPIVTAERYPGPVDRDIAVVWSDHAALMYQLLDHLHEQGARRPALLASDMKSDWSSALRRTFTGWCDDHDVPAVARSAPFGASPQVLRAAAEDLLSVSDGIDAIVCAADGAATTILPALRAAGRRVGDDLLLASCVDSTFMRAADPPVTAIDIHPRTLGAECARLLVEILAGETAPDTVRAMPISLQERGSTGA